MQNAELSPFNTSAQGAGQGPFQKGLRFLIERGVEGRLAFPPFIWADTFHSVHFK